MPLYFTGSGCHMPIISAKCWLGSINYHLHSGFLMAIIWSCKYYLSSPSRCVVNILKKWCSVEISAFHIVCAYKIEYKWYADEHRLVECWKVIISFSGLFLLSMYIRWRILCTNGFEWHALLKLIRCNYTVLRLVNYQNYITNAVIETCRSKKD